MHDLAFFQKLIEEEIKSRLIRTFPEDPPELYDPVRYMLQLGGKRIRPSLVLMSCEMFGGEFSKAVPAALGIEVFHNFTLLHDDIMDKAPLRRSQQTVHAKWNADVAILSGDAMFVKACQLMMQVDKGVVGEVMSVFLESSLLVCEGQQWDMTYQSANNITITEYLKMIELKTAALLACSLKTGAIIARASKEDADLIYDFGKNLGIAFQLHDDILDVYGKEDKVGKQQGGDIIVNKKTFLLLKAQELASSKHRDDLKHWLELKNFNGQEKVTAIKNIFQSLGVKELAEAEMLSYYNKALSSFQKIKMEEDKRCFLKEFAEKLMKREH